MFDSLISESWERRDENPGSLTLFTHRGDYWRGTVESGDMSVTNVLVKEINADNFTVTVDLKDFNPLNRFEQAGFVLFDEELSPSNIIRMTMTYTGPSGKVSNTEVDNQWVQTVRVTNGDPIEPGVRGIRHPELNDHPLPEIVSLRAEIDRINQTCYFFYSSNESAFLPVAEITISDFTPKYIGLVAFQGKTESPFPPIPAKFDEVRMEPR